MGGERCWEADLYWRKGILLQQRHDARAVVAFEHALQIARSQGARAIVEETTRQGAPAELLVTDLFWPTYERIEKLHRADQLTTLSQHLATRLLRVLVDQAALRFTRQLSRGRTIFAVCGPSDADEMGAQMAVDLIEGDGYDISFAGGGIANDEILSQVQEQRPDVLLLFASAPSDLPNIRSLIDQIREIGSGHARR